MSPFKAEVISMSVVVVKQVEKGMLVGSYPELRVGLASDDGNPHELCERMRDLLGARVSVTLNLEQPALFGARIDRATGEVLEGALAGSAVEPGEGE